MIVEMNRLTWSRINIFQCALTIQKNITLTISLTQDTTPILTDTHHEIITHITTLINTMFRLVTIMASSKITTIVADLFKLGQVKMRMESVENIRANYALN